MTTLNSASLPQQQHSTSHQPKLSTHFNIQPLAHSRQQHHIAASTDYTQGKNRYHSNNAQDNISMSYSSNRIQQQQQHNQHHAGVPRVINGSALSGADTAQGLVSESPTVSNERYQVKSKSGGRKGHQVTQSAGFKQMKHMVNKSFDVNALHGAHNENRQYQTYINGPMPVASHSPTSGLNLKLTNMNQNTGNIVAQFQTIQNAQQQIVQKRNHSFGTLNNSMNRKQLYNSIDSKKGIKPQSRAGASSGLSGEVPNSRGSRFITSNNKRINLGDVEGASSNGMQDPRRIIAQVNQDLSSMTSNIKANLIDARISQSKPQSSQRPRTSFGSFLDKQYDTTQQQQQDHQLQNSTIVLDEGIKPHNSQENTAHKGLLIKKSDRNENLRSYLRKSMDTSQNRKQQSDLQLPQAIGSEAVVKNGQLQRVKRKRDYSKVIGVPPNVVAQQYFTIQQAAQLQQQQPSGTNSPQKSGKAKKNLYQEQFNQMHDQKDQLMHQLGTIDDSSKQQQQQQKFMTIQAQDKVSSAKRQPQQNDRSGANSRGTTSQKVNRPASQNRMAIEQNPINATIVNERLDTIQQSIPEEAQQHTTVSKSEERPQSKHHKNQFNNMRASITQEVSTQPIQDKQKVDNCVSKFAFATKTGYSPTNPYKVNQDSFLAMPHLGEYRRTHFFSVCDGHGIFGKEVSEYVKTNLGQKVEIEIKQIFDNAKHAQRVVDSNEVKDALATGFQFVTQQLYTASNIDIYFSGSTCVSILIVGNKVFCANVGDSRAVLAREVNGNISGFPLNRDHKGSEPDEEKRILAHGGRVEALKDSQGRYMGPLRVWHLNENIPGLAMTRSFGDHAAAEVGCIAEPEILEMNLTEDDKFLVIASDGVWEFLENDEVVKIIEPHYKNNSAEKAAEALIKESLKKWKQEENVVDDITCIIIFLSIQ